MLRYANYQISIICIFTNINKTLEMRENRNKLRGCTYKFIYISAAYYPILPALVPI